MTTTNNFTDKISNEETAALPAIEFKGEIRIIEHERDIVPACKFLMKQAVVGFDTETRPSFRPGISYRVSLLQLSTPQLCFLFRLNKIPLAKPILQVLETDSILKIGADVAGDLRSMMRAPPARCARSATSATADSWTCSPSPPNGASRTRACANSRPSSSGSASPKPSV